MNPAALRVFATWLEDNPELHNVTVTIATFRDGIHTTFHTNQDDTAAELVLSCLTAPEDEWKALHVGDFTSLRREVPWGYASVLVANHPTDGAPLPPVRDWRTLIPRSTR